MQSGIEQTFEKHVLGELIEVGRLRVRRASGPMPMEAHEDAIELMYLDAGIKQINVAEKTVTMSGGDILVIYPGEAHGKLDHIQNRSTIRYLIVRDPTCEGEFLGLDAEERLEMRDRLYTLPARQFRASPALKKQWEALCETAQKKPAMYRARLRAQLLMLLLQVIDESACTKNALPEDIEKILSYIDAHPDQMPTVGDLADMAFLSEARFKQKFKDAVGVPPAEYILRRKTDKVKRALSEGRESVETLALRNGFSSGQHLSVIFKRYTGLSPTAYRNK